MVKTRDGRPASLRTLSVKDDTGVIEVNLWGEVAYLPRLDNRSATVLVRNQIPVHNAFTGTTVVNIGSTDDFEVILSCLFHINY